MYIYWSPNACHMKHLPGREQIAFYQANGFVVMEDFLAADELEHWRKAVMQAVAERGGRKIPGKDIVIGEEDGINEDGDYFGKVFDQLLNLWQTNSAVRELMLDERIGKMAAMLSGAEGIRIWHDQALFKRPWANPTAWHLDTPFWSFSDRKAISIWVALDDATLQNGCLYFIPGSHKGTKFDKIKIGRNMDGIFDVYPQYVESAGGCRTDEGRQLFLSQWADHSWSGRQYVQCLAAGDDLRLYA